ncbi:hypothetical protein Tco_0356434 [Tanacetum coccineum]
MNLQLSKGADREVFPLTKEDLSNLGTNEVLLKGLSIGDTDLDEKFYLFKNETYKDISLTKVKDIPKDEKGTTLILSEHLRFYHCNLLFTPPPPRSNLGRYMLHYVEDANALKKQPWVSLAITTLKEGGYDDKKRDVSLDGDMNLQLSKGADIEVFPLTKEDLSNLGTNEVLLKGLSIGDTDLDEKFYLFKNETYKDISLTKVKDIPKDEKGTTRSNLGRYMLHYVEDANALKKQPWVSLSITTLKEGGYDDKKRDVRFIGDALVPHV